MITLLVISTVAALALLVVSVSEAGGSARIPFLHLLCTRKRKVAVPCGNGRHGTDALSRMDIRIP